LWSSYIILLLLSMQKPAPLQLMDSLKVWKYEHSDTILSPWVINPTGKWNPKSVNSEIDEHSDSILSSVSHQSYGKYGNLNHSIQRLMQLEPDLCNVKFAIKGVIVWRYGV
jgi:hypothetical protein